MFITTDTPKEDKSEKSKEGDTKRPAIMKRLGGYIKDSASKKATKAWAKEQVSFISFDDNINLIFHILAT